MKILCLILLLMFSNQAFAEIEVYVGGKRYESFDQYKSPVSAERSKTKSTSIDLSAKIIKQTINDSIERIQKNIKDTNSKGYVEKLYKEDLAFVVKDAMLENRKPLLFVRTANKIKILRLEL